MNASVALRAGIPPFHVMDVWLAAAERQRSHGDLVNLSAGQPSVGAPEPVRAAAAAALHAAGISAARVRVHNPGGIAEVTLTGNDRSAPLAQLAGPVRRVARVEVDPADVGASEAVVVAS